MVFAGSHTDLFKTNCLTKRLCVSFVQVSNFRKVIKSFTAFFKHPSTHVSLQQQDSCHRSATTHRSPNADRKMRETGALFNAFAIFAY